MNVDSQPSGTGFSFEKRHMAVGFRVFKRDSEVEGVWLQYISLPGDFEVYDLIMLFGIQHPVLIGGQILAQVYIIRVGAEIFPIERFDHNSTLFDFLQYSFV